MQSRDLLVFIILDFISDISMYLKYLIILVMETGGKILVLRLDFCGLRGPEVTFDHFLPVVLSVWLLLFIEDNTLT